MEFAFQIHFLNPAIEGEEWKKKKKKEGASNKSQTGEVSPSTLSHLCGEGDSTEISIHTRILKSVEMKHIFHRVISPPKK